MRRLTCLALILLLVCAACPASAQQNLGALGRIKPKGGVVRLMGPAGEVVEKLLVEPGAVVRPGQALAVFAGKNQMEAELALARLNLKEARELQAKNVVLQENQVKVAQADLDLSRNTFANMSRIGADAFSELQVDQRKSQVRIAQVKHDSAVLELERLKADGAIRLERAQEQVKLASEKLARATLLAPGGGTILEINKSPGETCGGEPLLLMAELSVMYVLADIFEADLPLLKPGMEVSVSSKALGRTVKGRVETVGRLIAPQTKVAEVAIRLDEAEPASRLINSEVNVSINVTR